MPTVYSCAPLQLRNSSSVQCANCVLLYFLTTVQAMQRAAALFEGTHDFRNLCRIDAANVQSFTRSILLCKVHTGDGAETDTSTASHQLGCKGPMYSLGQGAVTTARHSTGMLQVS